MTSQHIVNLSGGACSFWAADRVANRYGTDNMVLLFADTLIEDAELYDFNAWTSERFGVPITRVSREITPWQLFRQQGMIANNRYPICSVMLKREPLDEWFRLHCTPKNSLFAEPDIAYVGLDWTETHRLESLRREKPQWEWCAPMLEWKPIWDKNKMVCELEKLGWSPRAYRDGFPHNNCGRRCVRAGITHFIHLYKTDPDAFLDWENEERVTRIEFAKRGISSGDFSVLKDRRGGVTKTLTFEQLRQRILDNDPSLPKDDWGGCGCAVEVKPTGEESV